MSVLAIGTGRSNLHERTCDSQEGPTVWYMLGKRRNGPMCSSFDERCFLSKRLYGEMLRNFSQYGNALMICHKCTYCDGYYCCALISTLCHSRLRGSPSLSLDFTFATTFFQPWILDEMRKAQCIPVNVSFTRLKNSNFGRVLSPDKWLSIPYL